MSITTLADALLLPKKCWGGTVLRRTLLAGPGIIAPDEIGPLGVYTYRR